MATETLRPNGVGNSTELFSSSGGDNYTNVDEVVSDDDTTYNRTATSGPRKDLYELSAPAGSGVVNGITVYALCRASTTGTVKLCIRTGATDYTEASGQALTTSYASYNKAWATNPNTSVAWTWADLGSLQAGVIMEDDGAGNRVRVTQVYVVVDYTLRAQRRNLLGVGW